MKTIVIVALLTTVAAGPVFPQQTYSVYKAYNSRLIWLYDEDVISYQTLRRLWLGPENPSQEYLDEIIEFAEILHASRASGFLRQLSPAAVTGSYNLSSSTPILPFLGNQLVISGAALFADDTNVSAVTLRRQADCSLVEDIFEPVNNLLTPASVVELTGAQDYLHMLSGLTTTPDVFPGGCAADPTLGTSAVLDTAPVGVTADNLSLVASIGFNGGLQVQSIDANNNRTTVNLSGGNVQAFVVADLNNDGQNDIVASGVTDPATGMPAYAAFLNNGDGTFSKPSYVDAPASILFTVDDVNGDGNPDIVINGPRYDAFGLPLGNVVTTLAGNGDGTFNAGVNSPAGNVYAPFLITGDFNGDGKKDLLCGGAILLGNGDGTFTAGPALSAAVQYELSLAPAAAAGDVNGDGNLDIVYSGTASGSGIVQVLLGNGDGTFNLGGRYASLTPAQQVLITDLDGDGHPDIFVGRGAQGLYVQDSNDNLGPLMQFLSGRGDGTFVGAPVYTQSAIQSVSTADFNGDGNPDVLVFKGNLDGSPGSLAVLPGDGAGNLGAAITSPSNMAASVRPGVDFMAVGDFNHDGTPDAVLAGPSNSGPVLAVMIGQGDGTFAGEQDYSLPDYPVSLAVGDFNGDGLADVAVGVAPPAGNTGPSGVYVLLGRMDGTLAAPVMIDGSLNPTGLAAADLNGDGLADLVIADQGLFFPGSSQQVNGGLHVYLSNGDGTFAAAASPSTPAANYTVAALGDLNDDGYPDLIVGGNSVGANGQPAPIICTLLGNGDGTFQSAQVTAMAGADGIGAQSLTLADFNGDGVLDLAIANINDFTEVWLGVGDGTFGQSLLTLGEQPRVLAAVDLNGDGLPDLLQGGSAGLAVFLNAAAWPVF